MTNNRNRIEATVELLVDLLREKVRDDTELAKSYDQEGGGSSSLVGASREHRIDISTFDDADVAIVTLKLRK